MDSADETPPFHSNRQRAGTLIPISNIGPRGQKRRLTRGLTTLVLAALLAGVLLAVDAPRAWRLAVFPLLWTAGLGVFQARAKT